MITEDDTMMSLFARYGKRRLEEELRFWDDEMVDCEMVNEMVDCETDNEMVDEMVDCETDNDMVDCETDNEMTW